MDWSNERYVRLYTRDTATWRRLGWEGQSLLCLMLRKVDRAGVIDGVVDAVDDLILMTGLPPDAVEVGYKALVRHKVIVVNGDAICLPNFLEAQETPKSDAQRQRDCRESRRAGALLESRNVTGESQPVTNESQNVTPESRGVTSSHGQSQCVTPTLTDPILTDPNRSKPNLSNKRVRSGGTYTDDFNAFWSAYPRSENKRGAFKAFKAAKKMEDWPGLEAVIEIIEQQQRSEQWTKDNGQFIPHPATWLNGGRWADSPRAQHQDINEYIARLEAEEQEQEAIDGEYTEE